LYRYLNGGIVRHIVRREEMGMLGAD